MRGESVSAVSDGGGARIAGGVPGAVPERCAETHERGFGFTVHIWLNMAFHAACGAVSELVRTDGRRGAVADAGVYAVPVFRDDGEIL